MSGIPKRIGVDLGGTKIEAVVIEHDPERVRVSEPVVLARTRAMTNRALGYAHVLDETCALVREVARQAGVDVTATPIGIGMPGATTMRTADGSRSDVPLVKNSNTTCLNGRPFHHDLVQAIGRPVSFANDANCFALAEATWGAARGARVTFGVIMGTGVGGGLVLPTSSRAEPGEDAPRLVPSVWNGAQGIAGEWGHVVLDAVNGRECYCGRRGCVETYLSGPAIEGEYARRGGEARSLREIAARAASKDDPLATELIAERIELFGRAIATVINIVDPDVIVLGGGVSNVEAFYEDGVRAVARWVFNDELETRIVKNTLGDSAGVLGAALLDAR